MTSVFFLGGYTQTSVSLWECSSTFFFVSALGRLSFLSVHRPLCPYGSAQAPVIVFVVRWDVCLLWVCADTCVFMGVRKHFFFVGALGRLSVSTSVFIGCSQRRTLALNLSCDITGFGPQPQLCITGSDAQPQLCITGSGLQPQLCITEFGPQPQLCITGFGPQPRLCMKGFGPQPQLCITGSGPQPQLCITGFGPQPQLCITGSGPQPQLCHRVWPSTSAVHHRVWPSPVLENRPGIVSDGSAKSCAGKVLLFTSWRRKPL